MDREKGNLIITKTKNGFSLKIKKVNGKEVSVSTKDISDDSMNGKECEFTSDKGIINTIYVDNKQFYPKESYIKPKPQPPKGNFQNQNQKTSTLSYNAEAPYNFVPLNEWIVPSENQSSDHSYFNINRKSGYITLNIQNRTPIFTRSAWTSKDVQENKTPEDFFHINQTYLIPGSSIRGMVRSVVEIFSFSKLQFTEPNRRLFFRSFADKSRSVRDSYSDYMQSEKGKPKKMKSGILKKIGYQEYVIQPAGDVTKDKGFGTNYDNKGISKEKQSPLYYVRIKEIKGKLNHYRIEANKESTISLDYDTDILQYKNDTSRSEDVTDVVQYTDTHGACPCFYVQYEYQGKKQIAFGHNPYFRFPYKKTVNEHIHQKEIKQGSLDLSESIFGIVHTDSKTKDIKSIAGRVFFSDAKMIKGETLPVQTLKILSNPKPTSFQLYLEQKEKELQTYNDDAPIRGFKRYWSFSPGNSWMSEREQNRNMSTRISPIKENSEFEGKIYFENLTDVELGAILYALTPNIDSQHKLGMAKPLGLGSISIKTELHLSQPEQRYTTLKSEWTEEITKSDGERYKDLFKNYILNNLKGKIPNSQKYEEIPRIKDMLLMMKFNGDKNFSYMKFPDGKTREKNLFRDREILKGPRELI